MMTGNGHLPFTLVEKIRFEHDTKSFDCGHSDLNRFLQRFALVNQNAGAALLKDPMLRTVQAAGILGIRVIFVHTKDDNAKGFYEHFNFKPSPTDPHHL